ncbi:MAG TPA: S16 family serine protease [Thermoanaerobaculia bacterium]|nr:S16 family serine protease [Thermoanaerobaculia bacterium]
MSPVAGRAGIDERLQFASVLVAIGDLGAGEASLLRLLADQPQDREALSLLAKIKHIRGELSAAFACWAQIHALAAEGQGAHMRLASMLGLAQDPERGAGEFLALGQNQLWRKPAALLELEGAFRLFVALRPDEARAACARLAQKSREQDRDLYKLAALAEAWIAELAGDPAHAAEALEQLGKERGFAGDTDRALALLRVYELLGRPEDLEKAIHVCEYLLRTLRGFERVSALGRLAALCRAVGRQADAAEYDQQFLLGFQAVMHRPTLADALAAATRHYLPLPRLAAASFVAGAEPDPAELPAEVQPRFRALRLALAGERAAARALFERGGEALDRKYLADLALLEGRQEQAVRLFLDTLAEDPGDPRVIGWLLDHGEGGTGGDGAAGAAKNGAAAIRRHFTAPERAHQAAAVLEAQIRESPRRPAAWRQLAALHRLRGDAAEARRCAERAAALATAAARRESAVGRVLSAAVYHFAGRAKGLIHEVWAARKPVAPGQGGFLDEILGNLTSELTQAVRNTFLAVREYARANLPHLTGDILDFNYSFKVTKEDEPSGGLSAGLPTALAFLSVFLDRPVPQDVASSGMLVTDAHDVLVVRPVGEAEWKVRGAYNRNLRLVILPEGNRGDLERSVQVPRPISAQLVRFVPDLDSAVGLVFPGAE